MTREEWLKRTNKEGTKVGGESRGKDGNKGVRDRSKLRCFNCQTYGHFVYECRKPRRDVRDMVKEVNLSKTEEDEPALLFTECKIEKSGKIMLNEEKISPKVKASDDGRNSQVWFLDNEASNHMNGQKRKFKTLDESANGLVNFGDDSAVNIKGKGTVSFKCKNGVTARLYFIPQTRNNIIILGQLAEYGNRVVLDGDLLWVHNVNGRLLMKATKSTNRLYKISLEASAPLFLLAKAEQNAWTWHARLGHVNF